MSRKVITNLVHFRALLLLLSMSLPSLGLAQDVVCPKSNYTIDSDADLAAFYSDAKNCNIVTGNITVTG